MKLSTTVTNLIAFNMMITSGAFSPGFNSKPRSISTSPSDLQMVLGNIKKEVLNNGKQ